jgi:hypothetical protein
MRNDASAAIAAFRKGSFGSPELQEAALIVNDIRIKLDILTPLLHVPGLALMAEGIDGASRGGHAFGPGLSPDNLPDILKVILVVQAMHNQDIFNLRMTG